MVGAVGRTLLGGDGPLVRDGVALRLAHHGRASLGRSARRLAARTHPLACRGKAQLRRVLLKGAGQALVGGIHDTRDSQNLLAVGKHVKRLAQKLAGELVERLGDVAVVLCLLGPSPLCHASANQRGCTHHMIPARHAEPWGRGKPTSGRAAGANRPLARAGRCTGHQGYLPVRSARITKGWQPSLPARHRHGGDDGDRTHDLRLAKPALSQLSYVPAWACRPLRPSMIRHSPRAAQREPLTAEKVINAPAATRLTLGRLLAKRWWARQGSNL